jgi:hypothetical protein
MRSPAAAPVVVGADGDRREVDQLLLGMAVDAKRGERGGRKSGGARGPVVPGPHVEGARDLGVRQGPLLGRPDGRLCGGDGDAQAPHLLWKRDFPPQARP